MFGNHLKKTWMVIYLSRFQTIQTMNNQLTATDNDSVVLIESIMLDMLIIYTLVVQSSHNCFYNVRNNLC